MEQSPCSVSELVGGDEPVLLHGDAESGLVHGGDVLELVHGGALELVRSGDVLELVHGGDEPEPAHGGALVLDGELVRGVARAGLLLVVVARACPSRDILLPSS